MHQCFSLRDLMSPQEGQQEVAGRTLGEMEMYYDDFWREILHV